MVARMVPEATSQNLDESPPLATVRLSGEKASPSTDPEMVWVGNPVAASHRLMVASPAPHTASVFPSAEYDTNHGFSARRVRLSFPVVVSHNRKVPSQPADASVVPSGEKARDKTAAVWPVRLTRRPPLQSRHR